MLDAYSAGRLLPTRTMVLDRREKYTRTEYAKAYDAGCFSHRMLGLKVYTETPVCVNCKSHIFFV